MTKGHTTINLDTKSQLAKLLATENIIIQHNNVSTASFNTKTRVLTLPIFKEQSGDVYDMLIAHECAHALFTPQSGWKKIQDDDELRTYVNVLEDTRIDKKIQKKYPGVVRNYISGFDILEKQNFFALKGKDINKDLMIIDKINIRSKSSDRLPFIFDNKAKQWLKKVDAIKTFTDVVKVAKEMLNWQKKQVDQMKKLPDFDDHPLTQNYDLDDTPPEEQPKSKEQKNEKEMSDGNDSKESEEDKKKDDLNEQNNTADSDEKKDKDKTDTKKAEPTKHAKGAGGEHPKKKLKSITNDAFEQKKEKLLDKKTSYFYGKLPEPNLDMCLTSYKTFLKDFRNHISAARKQWDSVPEYQLWIKDKFKTFRKKNKKTVMYLVKEFEMKKAATAYKRASTDKTGVIDPLKLKDYKFSEDIFKKMTIIPDGKNHGMIMLLDWSGSMSDCLMNTVEQLINLIDFVTKVNIPYEVYFFTSERSWNKSTEEKEKEKSFWNYKVGDLCFDDFKLVNCASHRMTKTELEESLTYLYHMANDYDTRWTRRDNLEISRGTNYGMPDQYNLGNTPLNEALLVCNTLIPKFQKKYAVEKLTFITLTDGGANSFRNNQIVSIEDLKEEDVVDRLELKQMKKQGRTWASKHIDYDNQVIIEHKKKRYIPAHFDGELTTMLLEILNTSWGVTNIGFYILKRVRRWDVERFVEDYKDWSDKENRINKLRKQMTKEKSVAVPHKGYNKYFLLDGRALRVENFDLQNAKIKQGTKGELKRIFGKSMKNRLVSRVLLNKFIAEVA